MDAELVFAGAKLTTTCPDCKGTGYAANPAWDQYRPGMDLDAFANEHGDQESRCIECDGKGWVLTDDGIVLARFIWQVTT